MMRSLLLAFFFLIAVNALSQTIVGDGRVSFALLNKLKTIREIDSVNVSVAANPDKEITARFQLQRQYTIGNLDIYIAKLSSKQIANLLLRKEVLFINEYHAPKEELNTGVVDYTLNKINKVHSVYPSIKGDSIFLSVKERAFDTTDIDLKGRVFSSGIQAATQTAHASVMATIIAGAGNSSPYALGVAPSAFVSSADFSNLFPEANTFYQQKNISVQNHSYGTVVENFYGNEAAAYDQSILNNAKLVQIFSAGNAGTETPSSGMYSGLQGVANLTGNFKQSKNTIAVAALDSAGNPMVAASKGPAYDGRLKPELSAYGEDGSSGAAALVSGATALLQDIYRRNNNRVLPSSDLMKAVLINSANEVGPVGIDYQTGYGSLNAYKAVETILQNRFFQGSLSQNEVKSFPIIVPANIAKLKVTVVWNDAAASVNAAKALVNDLDLQLKQVSTATTWLPWVLDPNPALNTLQAAAVRIVDTLNVVEQITLDNPTPGSYSIDVQGTRLATPNQSFSVVYQFDTAASFVWTFPTSTDPLIAGKTQWLRWETSIPGNGQIEYATNGNNWRAISTSANLSNAYYKWQVPDTATTVVLRMRISSGAIFLSDTFVISPQLNMQTGFNCTDSFLICWNALPQANYTVYELGGKYLQPFSQQADTSVFFSKTQHPSLYYGVAPLINNKQGLRSQTINYAMQGVDCYIKSFYLQLQTLSAAFFTAEIGSLFHVQEVALEKLTPSGFNTIKTISLPVSTIFQFTDSSLINGENRYRFRVKLNNGMVAYSNTEVVYYLPDNPVLLYPNPAQQDASISIIAKESGRYSLQFFDAAGKLVRIQQLNSSYSKMPANRLSKGIYFVRIIDSQGKSLTQKLVIY